MGDEQGFIEDRGADFKITEYRCSMCQQIGGDSDMGAYDGCPKNKGKKHDMNGGEV